MNGEIMPAGKKDNWCKGGGTNIESEKAKIVRCPVCNRRLMLKTILHQPPYPEVEAYVIPPHKEKK